MSKPPDRAICTWIVRSGGPGAREALAFEGIDDVHGSHSLPPRMFRVCHRIAYYALEKELKIATHLGNTSASHALDSTTTREASDRRFGYPVYVVAQHFPMPDRKTFAKTLAAKLAASTHRACVMCGKCFVCGFCWLEFVVRHRRCTSANQRRVRGDIV